MKYKNNRYLIEKVKVDKIANRYGTPIYCYSYNKLKENILSSINSLGVKLSQGEQRLSLSDLSPYFNNSSREFEIIGST